ncbi:conserved hypothetical protein [Candidatus Magnetomoraceae bacterium gMMP-1]
MLQNQDTIKINANIDLSANALQTIVRKAKEIYGKDEKGRYVDTAELVSIIISDFLMKNDFDAFVENNENYHQKSLFSTGS